MRCRRGSLNLIFAILSQTTVKLTSHGKGAYEAIDQIAVLDQVMRQGGNNAKSFVFRTALTKLYSDFVNNSTWKLLLTKYKQGLSTNKIADFNNTIQLYNTRVAVGKYNINRLHNLLQPVVAIKSIDTNIG